MQMKGGAAAVQLRGHTVDSNYSVCVHHRLDEVSEVFRCCLLD